MHGLDFYAYLPPPGPPVIVSLHLPLDWYPPEALAPARPDTFLHPVSETQARTAPPGARLLHPIANGVRTPRARARRRGFAFTLGRICPEKGQDDALDAAARAGMPLLVAGLAYPYAEHQAFLRERVLPRLDRTRRWVGTVAGHTKERLLAQARCVVIPSKAAETSSLVAMEAMAAGTPVVAYRAGALPEIVEHGRTGLLVDIGDIDGLASAMRAAEAIDPDLCRATARERFSLVRMTGAYMARYAELTRRAAA
jgi:glycosyltransferase involved in cell wall biosynthesis